VYICICVWVWDVDVGPLGLGMMVMAALPRAVSHRDDRGSHKQPTMHPTLVTDGSCKSHSGTGLGAATGPQRPKRNRKLKLQGGDVSALGAVWRPPFALPMLSSMPRPPPPPRPAKPAPGCRQCRHWRASFTSSRPCRSTDKPTATVSQAWYPSHHARVQGDAPTP